MKNYITRTLILGFIFCSANQSKAQYWLGTNLSNQSATHAAYVNPAILGGVKNKIYINAAGFSFNIMNDYISWGAPFNVRDYFSGNVDQQYMDSTGNVPFRNEWLAQKLDGTNKNFYFETELRGPAIMYRLSKKSAITFGVRSRTGFNITNVSENLAKLAVNGVDSNINSNSKITVGSNLDNLRLRASALSYQEYALGFGKQFLEIRSLKIKFGATAKFLMGNAYLYSQGNNIDFTVNGDDSIRINQADFQYGYSDLNKFQNFSPNSLLPSLGGDYGFAWDAGAVVEYNPAAGENLRNKSTSYLFKMGLSLLDMGRIKFKNNVVNNRVQLRSPFTFVPDSATEKAFEDGPFSDDAKDYADSLVQANFDVTKSSEAIYGLPSVLSVQLDYNVLKNFYVGAIWYQDIRGTDLKKLTLHRPSQITLIPRFESNWLEASLPINLGGDYKVLQVGGYVRIGPVYAGSDNLKALITQENFYGVNAYFGLAQGIGKNKKKKAEEKEQANINFAKSIWMY